MIELKQMTGTSPHNGKRHVFNTDIVYRVAEDGTRQQLGFIDRKPGAKLALIVRLTDDEADAVQAEVNAARAEQGRFAGVVALGEQPPDQALVDALVDDTEEEEEDADYD